MCLIAATKKCKTLIPERYLDNALYHNSDGFGIMFAPTPGKKPGKGPRVVNVIQSMSSKLEDVRHALSEVPKGVPVAFHARFGTAGAKTAKNLHPFMVSEHHENAEGLDLYMMHNGTFSQYKRASEPDKSDTANFVSDHMRPLLRYRPTMIRESGFRVLLESYCAGSKLTFMDGAGRITIINEEAGKWESDVWYSNEYSLADPYKWSRTSNSYGYGKPSPLSSMRARGYKYDENLKGYVTAYEDDKPAPKDDLKERASAYRGQSKTTLGDDSSAYDAWFKSRQETDQELDLNYKGDPSVFIGLTDKEIFRWVIANPEDATEAISDFVANTFDDRKVRIN